MQKEDILLMVLDAGQDQPFTPVQLQKALFLIGNQCVGRLSDPYYDFEPYHYGPFDVAVYQDAEELVARGLAWRFKADGGSWINTVATPSGRAKANQLRKDLDPAVVRYIQNVAEWTQKLSFSELVAAIYHAFPEFKQNSVFRG